MPDASVQTQGRLESRPITTGAAAQPFHRNHFIYCPLVAAELAYDR
jgi:hypothetical protein